MRKINYNKNNRVHVRRQALKNFVESQKENFRSEREKMRYVSTKLRYNLWWHFFNIFFIYRKVLFYFAPKKYMYDMLYLALKKKKPFWIWCDQYCAKICSKQKRKICAMGFYLFDVTTWSETSHNHRLLSSYWRRESKFYRPINQGKVLFIFNKHFSVSKL